MIGTDVETVDPLVDPRWRRLAEATDALYSSPAWLACLREGYPLQPTARLLVGDGHEPVAGLAACTIDDAKGRRVVALPFSDDGDPLCADEVAVVRPLLEAAMEPGTPFTARVRQAVEAAFVDAAEGAGMPLVVKDRLAWHTAALPLDEGELWNQIASGARQNVRRARSHQLTVTVHRDLGGLLAFRRLHVDLRRRKYRMLAQPTRFFEAIARWFGPDDLRVVLAERDGDVVAGVVLLRSGRRATYKFNASTEAGLSSRANDLVMWHSLVEAIGWGCTRFDFGVSDLDQPGLVRYKRKYATDESSIVVLDNGLSLSTRRSRLMAAALPRATRLLTAERCPTPLTARGGDLLYRWFC